MNFSLKLKAYRKANKMTQIQLCKILDVSKGYLAMIEQGQTPGEETAAKIRELLNSKSNPKPISEGETK